MELSEAVGLFVQKGWHVTSQTENSASLEKKASSRTLGIVLGIVPVLITLFVSTLVGILMLGGVLLLLAINNATKKSGTLHISRNSDGTLIINSNMRKLNQRLEPGIATKLKV